MPALSSPRSREKGADAEGKKSMGMMGRLKSTFGGLGRRKSTSSSDGINMKMAVPESTAVLIPSAEQVVDAEEDVREGKADVMLYPQEPSQYNSVEEESVVKSPKKLETEIVQFMNNTMEEEEAEEEEKETKASYAAKIKKNERQEEKEEEKVQEEDGEEVFASDYKDQRNAEEVEEEEEEELEVFEEDGSNQGSGSSPLESDLMIIGVAPGSNGPTQSLLYEQESKESEEDRPAADTKSLEIASYRIASAHSNRNHDRQPLLSEFLFGSELGSTESTAPVAQSPLKRRSAASPAGVMRRSFQREQELQIVTGTSTSVAVAPSPKRKPDTPSAIPSSRSFRAERVNSLQGICEDKPIENDMMVEEESVAPPSSPRRVSRDRPASLSRRRSSTSLEEAPILASSYVSSAPEVHEECIEPSDVDAKPASATSKRRDEKEEDNTDSIAGSKSTIAFDAHAAITQEFGERVFRLLSADPWGDRQDGFDAIQYQIKKTDLVHAKNKRELFCATIAAVQRGVEDRVAPVMYCALETLRHILKEFAPALDRHFIKYTFVNEQLSALIKSIVNKLGDSNKRTQREAGQAIVRLAKLKKLKVLPHVLLYLSAKEVAPRLRVETLRLLVNEIGVEGKNGLNVEVLMQFALPALKIAEEKTRKAAVELIAELHVMNGQAVNAQLAGTKPEMLRVINQRVDELMAKKDEERLVQAAQNVNQAEETNDDDAVMELVPVPVEDAKTVVAMLDNLLHHTQTVIGPVTWRKLESKTWNDRKEALVEVEKTVTEAKSDLRDVKPAFNSVVQQNFLAYCLVVYRCVGDSIAPVVNSAMDCFSTLIKIYGPYVEWREEMVRDVVMLAVMRLFSTMQKPSNRTNRAACRCILKLTRLTNPHTLRYTLSCVFAKETDALVQMHLVRLLVPEFGFQPDGISPSQVLAVVATALVHTNDKVRKTAIDVALCTQRLVGKELVLAKLKDHVKAVTLKELEKQFVEDKIKDTERPQTVQTALPPVQFASGSEQSRRSLQSAPVGLGKLHCTPPENERGNEPDYKSVPSRRGSVLSNEEENFMDSILDSD